jgi:regulatory protein
VPGCCRSASRATVIRRTRPKRRASAQPEPAEAPEGAVVPLADSRSARERWDSERADDPRAVRGAAVTLLARRDYPSSALRERLQRQGFEPSRITEVLAELVAEHAIDDARYARNYVAYHSDRGHGPVRISADLRALGLPAELIDTALAGGPDWRSLARRARVRKFGSEKPGSWSERARQARFLQYRGFSSDHIRSALGPDFTPEE